MAAPTNNFDVCRSQVPRLNDGSAWTGLSGEVTLGPGPKDFAKMAGLRPDGWARLAPRQLRCLMAGLPILI